MNIGLLDDGSWSLIEGIDERCSNVSSCDSWSSSSSITNRESESDFTASPSISHVLQTNAKDAEDRQGTFHGKVISSSGKFYEGTMIYHRGTKPFRMFQGNWRSDGTFQSGMLVYSNDNVYSGDFDQKNEPHGWGKYIQKSGGLEYHGEWVHGLQQGRGCETLLKHGEKEVYEGQFQGDLRHGFGACSYDNGTQYSGTWYHGRRHGVGKLVDDASGYILQDGEWGNDEFIGVCHTPTAGDNPKYIQLDLEDMRSVESSTSESGSLIAIATSENSDALCASGSYLKHMEEHIE